RRLVEGGVHPPVSRIDEPRERLQIGRVQLVELSPLQQGVDHRVRIPELLQDARVRGELSLRRLLPGLETELVVQDRAQLWRRVQVELFARVLEDLRLE